jgi:hypothetical protein
VFWWLFFVMLGMQLAVNRVDGGWTSLARNVRHTIVFVYPMILLLTGYLVALRARWPRVCDALLLVLLAFGLSESVSTAEKTKQAFADRRQALTFIASLPSKPCSPTSSSARTCRRSTRARGFRAWSSPATRRRAAPGSRRSSPGIW